MKKRKKNPTPLFRRWTFWFAIMSLLILAVIATTEHVLESSQPSKDWSIAVESIPNLPGDARKIDVVSDNGFTVAYLEKDGVHVIKTNDFGVEQERAFFESDESKTRVLLLEIVDDTYWVYTTDREDLYRWVIRRNDLSLVEKTFVSNQCKYTVTHKNFVLTGSNDRVELYEGNSLLHTFDALEMLYQLTLKSDKDTIFAFVNSNLGATLLYGNRDNMTEKMVYSESNQNANGYVKDIYIDDHYFYVIANTYDRFKPGEPSLFTFWTFDRISTEEVGKQLFYHVATDLSPILIDVQNGSPTYILGTRQQYDPYTQGLSRYQYKQGGTFVNVSRYRAQDGLIVENTRLTMTRNYPMAYAYFAHEDEAVFAWIDKVGSEGTFNLSGQGQEWIRYAKSVQTIEWKPLAFAVLNTLGNGLGWGSLFIIMIVAKQAKWLFLTVILVLLIKHIALKNNDKQESIVYYIAVFSTVAFKVFLMIEPQSDFWFYGSVYPMFFQSGITMAILALVTSAMAYAVGLVWQKQHPYYPDKFIHYWVYLGLEIYVSLFTVITFLVAAMQKMKFMM